MVGYLLIRLIKPPYILFIEYIAFGKLRIEAVQSSRHAFRVRLSVTYRLQSLGIDARRYEVIYHRLSATLRKCDIILLRSFTVGVCDKFNRYIGIVVQHLRQRIESLPRLGTQCRLVKIVEYIVDDIGPGKRCKHEIHRIFGILFSVIGDELLLCIQISGSSREHHVTHSALQRQ